MHSLGIGLQPLAHGTGFIQAPLDAVAANLSGWLKEIKGPQGISVVQRELRGNVRAALDSLQPLTSGDIDRYLLIPTDGPWTAYLDNLQTGTDAAGVAYLAQRMRCTSVLFVADSPRMERDQEGPFPEGALVFSVYGPSGGSAARDVRLFRDIDGWVFKESGVPLPFEDTTAYRASRIEDRFTIEMLERYLKEMGIRAFEEDFYRPSATCLVATRKSTP